MKHKKSGHAPSVGTPNPLRRIEYNTLQEQVHRRMREGLIDGQFQPGQVLTIRYLAEQLGTSVMPVREALHKLTVERVLDLLPTRSVRVPVLSVAEFTEICDARVVLEGAIVELAAERANATDIARIETVDREFQVARVARDQLRKNREFHFAIYESAHHPTLMGLIEPLWVRCGPCTLALFEETGLDGLERGASPRHHEALEAIRLRQPARARAAIVADVLATRNNYQRHVERTQVGVKAR
jgi:DNA-binding GntR family transcriptional regulator